MNKSLFGILIVCTLSACVGPKGLINSSSKSVSHILKNAQEKGAEVDWFTAQLKGQARLNDKTYPISAHQRFATRTRLGTQEIAIFFIGPSCVSHRALSYEILKINTWPPNKSYFGINAINAINAHAKFKFSKSFKNYFEF